MDVYPTHRTAAAPQWVYDNTFKNATRAKIVELHPGRRRSAPIGGIPFPIPTTGAQVMWNHLLHWRGEDWHFDVDQYLGTADGRLVLSTDGQAEQAMPYYYKELGSPRSTKKYNGDYWLLRLVNSGPPIRAGEAIVGRENVDDDKTNSWVYLTGQRRVRKLPNPCCDTPTPATAGVMSFDELEVFAGRMDRFNWKLIGKKEMYIPYNDNKIMQPTKDAMVLMPHHLNPGLRALGVAPGVGGGGDAEAGTPSPGRAQRVLHRRGFAGRRCSATAGTRRASCGRRCGRCPWCCRTCRPSPTSTSASTI